MVREFLAHELAQRRTPAVPGAAPTAEAPLPDLAHREIGGLPRALWVTPDDLMVVGIRNAKSGVSVGVNARLWHPDDGVHELNLSLTPGTARALQFFNLRLHNGFLLHAAATAQAGSPNRGQTLVSMYVARPPASAFATKWFLGQDYLTSQDAIYFPGGRNTPGTEGPGMLYSIAVATPAAGADWSQTVPTGARWRIHGIAAKLVTSATVASRAVGLVHDDGINTFLAQAASNVQTASTSVVYSYIPGWGNAVELGVSGSGLGLIMISPLPFPAPLLAGWRVRPVTAAIQAGDQWSAILLLVEEWLED